MTWLLDWLLSLGRKREPVLELHHAEEDDEEDDDEEDEWNVGLP